MRKSHKIRLRADAVPRFFRAGERISRQEAIERIREYLALSARHPEAVRLIGLFSIAPEELSEAGLSYEMLIALERQALFI
jgi:hypothetical protein